MTKETVRYPDEVVAAVEDVIADGVFESKSEFYRFSAEYVLDSLLDDYEPETFDFEDIVADLDAQHGLAPAEGDDDGPFLSAFVAVRRHCLRGEFDAAEAVVDDRFDGDSVEAVLLEELLERYRHNTE